MQRVNSYDKIKVTEITLIEFFIGSDKDSVDFDIVPLQACQLLLGKPQISKNNIVYNSIANKYYFKYNGRKITLIPMNATEILQDDLERAERRKTEPSRREWAISYVSTLSSKSDFFYKMKILLCLLLELIFCTMNQKKRTS